MPAREGLKSAVTALGSGRARGRNCCEAAGEIMTTSPRAQVRPLAEAAEHQARLLPPARYRYPGDVIRLHVETAG
jgi:hypothetical protein